MKIYKVKVNGKTYEVQLESVTETKSETPVVAESKKEAEPKAAGKDVQGTEVLSPIQGTVINVKVNVGSKVKKGDVLVVIEAMKLENEVNAPCDGEVVEVAVNKSQQVQTKQLLVKIK